MFQLFSRHFEPVVDQFKCVVDAMTAEEAFALADRFSAQYGEIVVIDTSTGHRIPAPVPHHATGEDPASND